MTSVSAHHPGTRDAAVVTALLAAAGGIVDATSYLLLGGVFTGVLTGNLVVFGAAVTTGQGAAAMLRPATALLAFPLGIVSAVALLDRRPASRLRTEPALVAVAFFLIAATVVAGTTGTYGARRSGAIAFILLTVLAAAMGVQNAAMRRVDRLPVSTTFLTGMIAGAAAGIGRRLAGGDRASGRDADKDKLPSPGAWLVPLMIACYLAGAAATGLTRHSVGLASPGIAAIAVIAAAIYQWCVVRNTSRRSKRKSSPDAQPTDDAATPDLTTTEQT